MLVNGVDVKVNGLPDVSEQEIVNYIGYVKDQTHEPLKSLSISKADEGGIAWTTSFVPKNSSVSAASPAIWWERLTVGTMPSSRKSTSA